MARPRKQTVDWFPHSVNHGKTIFILEQQFGIKGYAFWFKLLELLGNTEGHSIDFSKKASWVYLQAITQTDDSTCAIIMNLLAELEAIDPELWKNKVVWSDNFVKGLAPAYRNRNITIPVKPVFTAIKPGQPGKNGKISTEEGEEEKEKKRRRKDITPPGPAAPVGAFFFSCKYFDVDFDYRMKLAKEYPVLSDEMLFKEFSKMEDWISDNKKKKKFKANGHLANPKLFIKNWLSRIIVNPPEQGKNMDAYLDFLAERNAVSES